MNEAQQVRVIKALNDQLLIAIGALREIGSDICSSKDNRCVAMDAINKMRQRQDQGELEVRDLQERG